MLKFVYLRAGVDTVTSVLLKNDRSIRAVNTIASNMISKQYRVKKSKPPPFPYETKDYNWWRSIFDHTYTRFDENSKLIVIEGPIASGKEKLAKIIADEFEMKYIPTPTMDVIYINDYGYDMRNLDPKLPDAAQSFDEKKFCLEPLNTKAAAFQLAKYRLRYAFYWDAITHLLNTGQGVVTVRSPFSDAAYLYAMRECKYISREAKCHYQEVVRHTILHLYRPHLIIYLDVPVNSTIENIKKRGIPHEVDSPALTPEFHKHMIDYYKNIYLRESSVHSKQLMYNWADEPDPDVVIEDIERINFGEHFRSDDLKLIDWRLEEDEINYDRVMYSTEKIPHMIQFVQVMYLEAPEMYMSGNDHEVWDKVWHSAPGMEFAKGYNIVRGDKNVWFKTKNYKKWDPLC